MTAGWSLINLQPRKRSQLHCHKLSVCCVETLRRTQCQLKSSASLLKAPPQLFPSVAMPNSSLSWRRERASTGPRSFEVGVWSEDVSLFGEQVAVRRRRIQLKKVRKRELSFWDCLWWKRADKNGDLWRPCTPKKEDPHEEDDGVNLHQRERPWAGERSERRDGVNYWALI